MHKIQKKENMHRGYRGFRVGANGENRPEPNPVIPRVFSDENLDPLCIFSENTILCIGAYAQNFTK